MGGLELTLLLCSLALRQMNRQIYIIRCPYNIIIVALLQAAHQLEVQYSRQVKICQINEQQKQVSFLLPVHL